MARLLNADVSATVDSAAVRTYESDRRDYKLVQCEITVAATVKIQGRLADDLPWVDIHTFTASGGQSVAMWREIRASVTGNTGAVTVHADI